MNKLESASDQEMMNTSSYSNMSKVNSAKQRAPQYKTTPTNTPGSAPTTPGSAPTTPGSAPGTPQGNGHQSKSLTRTISNTSQKSTDKAHRLRESGFIEKILHSYGFIQCVDRNARLFFHFSEYHNDTNEMAIGESVEFQMSFDRMNGKPIAVFVVKMEGAHFLASESILHKMKALNVKGELPEEDRIVTDNKVFGKVVKLNGDSNSLDNDSGGRISYEQSGEVFFLPFMQRDIVNNVVLKLGDNVSFHVLTIDKKFVAHRVLLINDSEDDQQPIINASECLSNNSIDNEYEEDLKGNVKKEFNGVICCLKDHFGFIERSDIVRELFFHYTEVVKTPVNQLKIGDDVTYNIQMRNNKEVATSVTVIQSGTVIFEDISTEKRRGKIHRLLNSFSSHGNRSSNPLSGVIVYETIDGSIEINYGDKDQRANYSLRVGDCVHFNIATDRRDSLLRATNIALIDNNFNDSNEQRNTGYVINIRDNFGFLECLDLNMRIFFHFDEILTSNSQVRKGDEFEFTLHVEENSTTKKNVATRLVGLRKGSIPIVKHVPKRWEGIVERAAVSPTTPNQGRLTSEYGLISYYVNGEETKLKTNFLYNTVSGPLPEVGDSVTFQFCDSKSTKKKVINVMLKESRKDEVKFGYIATIKENFGFIENETHDQEIYFNFCNLITEASQLELGDEVEYRVVVRRSKICAEFIKAVPKGTVSPEEVLPEIYHGEVIRPLRIVDPEQDHYPGIIMSDGRQYQFGITSLLEKRDYIQTGDKVSFKLSRVISTGIERATNISTSRKIETAQIDLIKGDYGFLNFEVETNKKLFFHLSEFSPAKDPELGESIREGDLIEFVVVRNQRNDKYSACQLRKIGNSKRNRPEKLSRLKSMGDELVKTSACSRQPKGPINGPGFRFNRSISCPVGCSIKESGDIDNAPIIIEEAIDKRRESLGDEPTITDGCK